MATYKGIQGYTVQKLSDDPTASEAVGQLWYNSTSGDFKIATEGSGAWASGTPFNTGRAQLGCAGDTSTAVIFGGDQGAPAVALVESWNGTAWTEVQNLPAGTFRATGLGTATAAMSVGGTPTPTVGAVAVKWDGTSWAATNSLNNARASMGGSGTQTAGMVFGGGDYTDYTEEFDGTCWSEEADLNGPARMAGAPSSKGTTTASMYSGGETGPSPATRAADESEKWDGTSWAEGNDLNTARKCGGSGITTAAMAYGGGSPALGPRVALTEVYDGTSWSEGADLATAVVWNSGLGAGSTSAFCMGGSSAAYVDTSSNAEEWADPSYTIKTVTVS